MEAVHERRRAQRFPLNFPLEIKWQEPTGEARHPASTRDISATGIYFLFDREPQPESKLEFFVHLQFEGAPAGGVLLHCLGSIVRVERRNGEVGIAARIERYRFMRPGEDALTPESEEEE